MDRDHGLVGVSIVWKFYSSLRDIVFPSRAGADHPRIPWSGSQRSWNGAK